MRRAGAHSVRNVTPSCDASSMSIRRIDLITRAQYALITRAQALAAGLTDGQVEVRLRTGAWIEIRPSVYAIAGAPQSWPQILLASVLAHGCESWATHATGCHLWQLKGFDQPEELELVARLGTLIRLDGVRGRRSGALFDSDLTTHRRIPTVTAERALIDVSSRLTADRLGRVLDDAMRRRLINLEEFRRCAQRLLPAPGRSMSKVHAVLGARIPGYDPGDSDLETERCGPSRRQGYLLPSSSTASASTESRVASTSPIPT